jgi:two-component system CheB/CheR fusion protein
LGLVLPLRDAPVTPIASEVRSSDRRLIQVALVEDNADARVVLAEMPEMLEYRVFTAQDAAEGLRILEQRPVDIVLADIGLPDMDGYEFLRAVHRLPRFARLPAFAVSGYGRESDAHLAREAGFLAHLVKPVDIAALDRRIRECLAGPEPQVAFH